MEYKSYSQLIHSIQQHQQKSRVVLASAEDEHALEAVLQGRRDRIVEPILVGHKHLIKELLIKLGENPNILEIVDVGPDGNSAQTAIDLINEGRADFLMKGKMDTSCLLKAVVDKKNKLHTDALMSHLAILEMPSYKKLLVVSDGGMVAYPNLEQKKQIVENAVAYLTQIGYKKPKIAILAGVEHVNPKMQETVDAAELVRLNQEGLISGCVINGPISYDVAMSMEIATVKSYPCENCGDFDVLIVPELATGNILSKSLIINAGAKMAGMVVGAKIPIVLSSRGASAEEKYLSLAICAAAVQTNTGVMGLQS